MNKFIILIQKFGFSSLFKLLMMVKSQSHFEIKLVKFFKRHLSLSFQLLINLLYPPFQSMEIAHYVRSLNLSKYSFKFLLLVSNSSQTITTVRTSSSIDMQQQSKKTFFSKYLNKFKYFYFSNFNKWYNNINNPTINRYYSSTNNYY